MQTHRKFVAELLGTSSIAALMVDSSGSVVSANHAAEVMFACSSPELAGRPFSSLCTPKHDELVGETPCWCTSDDGHRFPSTVSKLELRFGGETYEIYVVRSESDPVLTGLDEKFQRAILDLARAPEVASGDFRRAAERITEQVARVMDVERVSLWLLTDEGRTLECVSLYELSRGVHSSGTELRAEEYPSYFDALEQGRAIAAHDAATDPRTREFRPTYLDVLGITSLLDAVIRVSGEVVGVVCHEHVLTPRTWHEEEIVFAGEVADQAAHAYLVSKHREAEAARAKLEEDLQQSRKLEAIGRLAGGVAHDFNNLLSVILGYAEIAESAESSVERSDCLEEIRSAGARAAELTNQLLSIGRRQVLQTRPIDLNELVPRVLRLLRRVIPENIEMEFAPDESPVVVLADGGQLEQLVINLCLNSRDALPDGGRIDLGVRCEPGPERNESRAVLTVTDDGVGMPDHVLAHVFEPFYTTKGDRGGTGLGLSMVYGIARQHGGHVDVTSSPERGTSFRVHLPGCDRELLDRIEDELPAESRSVSPGGGSEHVLVAEDSASIRGLLKRMLEKQGYRVTLCEDGDEVVRVHDEIADDVDLVLLDVIMPRRNGADAFRAIRERDPDVPVIFTTGYGAESLSEELLDAKDIQVLRKPWDSGELLATIRRAIS